MMVLNNLAWKLTFKSIFVNKTVRKSKLAVCPIKLPNQKLTNTFKVTISDTQLLLFKFCPKLLDVVLVDTLLSYREGVLKVTAQNKMSTRKRETTHFSVKSCLTVIVEKSRINKRHFHLQTISHCYGGDIPDDNGTLTTTEILTVIRWMKRQNNNSRNIVYQFIIIMAVRSCQSWFTFVESGVG